VRGELRKILDKRNEMQIKGNWELKQSGLKGRNACHLLSVYLPLSQSLCKKEGQTDKHKMWN
jgi:hypothetical protein